MCPDVGPVHYPMLTPTYMLVIKCLDPGIHSSPCKIYCSVLAHFRKNINGITIMTGKNDSRISIEINDTGNK